MISLHYPIKQEDEKKARKMSDVSPKVHAPVCNVIIYDCHCSEEICGRRVVKYPRCISCGLRDNPDPTFLQKAQDSFAEAV